MAQKDTKIVEFFDNIAPNYRNKYTTSNIFHNYFFNQRLQLSTEKIDFSNKNILDIGAGTGNLYDFIASSHKNINYWASDISKNMLEQSNIPSNRQIIGKIYEAFNEDVKFDFIFMLGVTTYLSREELENHFQFIKKHLKPNGKAIITFTNKNSFDDITRSSAKKILVLFKNKNNVLGQGFKIYKYTLKDLKRIVNPHFKIVDIKMLNQTVFPFNLAFAKTSIALGNKIASIKKNTVKNFLSSDTLIFLENLN